MEPGTGFLQFLEAHFHLMNKVSFRLRTLRLGVMGGRSGSATDQLPTDMTPKLVRGKTAHNARYGHGKVDESVVEIERRSSGHPPL